MKSLRRYEELKKILLRVNKLYDGIIINGDGEDSFQSPKEFILNFFRCIYELKENLKIDYPNMKSNIEKYIISNKILSLAIDIANQEKHGLLNKPKTDYKIGDIIAHIHIFDPSGKKDRTELTILINEEKVDCLTLLNSILNECNIMLKKHNLLQ